jgi:hypothetical protein
MLARTVVVGVIPACALAGANACGGATTASSTKDGGHVSDSGADAVFTVAAVAYPAYESGVPDTGGSGDAAPDTFFGVAAVAYPAYEAGTG